MQLCKSRPGVMQRRDKLHRRCKVAKMASITENCICILFKEIFRSNPPPSQVPTTHSRESKEATSAKVVQQ